MHARSHASAQRSLLFLALGAILAVSLASRAMAAWGTAPVTAGGSAGFQSAPALAGNSSGGFFVGWIDRRDTSGVWANRVDSVGVTESATGFPIATPDNLPQGMVATNDGTGGMIVAWSDLRTNPRSVWVQRLTASGFGQWTINGVRVSSGAGAQLEPSIAFDGTGGVFVAWQDQRNGNADIYAQHVLANGTLEWGAAGVAVCIADSAQSAPRVVHDGLGGAVIVWEDRRNNSDVTVQGYLQRLSAAGGARWTTNGIALDGTGSAVHARIASGPNQSTVVAFADEVGGNTGLYAQRFDSTGASLYTSGNRATLTTTLGANLPIAAFARSNGQSMFIYGSPTDLRARAITSTGSSSWGPLALANPAPAAAAGVTALSDGADGAWVTWTDTDVVRAQHVVSGGTLPLGNATVTVSPATSHWRSAAASLLLPSGDLAVAWVDALSGSPDTNIVVQRVGPNGLIGAYHRVFATAGAHGSLSPAAGRYYVAEHDSLRFVATSASGYHVDFLTVDGGSVGPIPNYTFLDITSDHLLTAAFSNLTLSQPTITAPDVYVPLSFPMTFANDSSSRVLAPLGTPNAANWRFGRWDPVLKTYVTPPASLTRLLPGQGYWFATKVADTLDVVGSANPEAAFSLALNPTLTDSAGWNQVGQPFRFPVAVSALRVRSGAGSLVPLISSGQALTGKQVFGWDAVNGYTARTVLAPGASYWVHKEVGANVSLVYPFEYSQSIVNMGAPSSAPNGAWAVRLHLTQAGEPAAHVELGASSEVGEGWNAWCAARVPDSPGYAPALWSSAGDWGARSGDYSTIYRADAATLAWDVYVRGDGQLAQAELTVALDGLPQGREVALSDPASGWTRIVHDGERVALAVSGAARHLRVSVAASGSLTPAGLAGLRALAPNPFSERAALSFALPAPGDVDAQVFDVSGRRVATLTRRGLSAGEHVIEWNGRDASGVRVKPGVYLLRWSAGGRTGAARLVSLR